MTCLYVVDQGSLVRKTSDRLIISHRKETLREVPCLHLTHVVLVGNVQITTQALAELLDHGVSLALLSRRGRLRGRLVSPLVGNADLRLCQYDVSRSPGVSLELARTLVRAKIGNTLRLVQRFRENKPEQVSLEHTESLTRLLGTLATATTLESIRGVEGAAAAESFGVLARVVPPAFGFTARNRRPPTDPVNALLSFGYTLLMTELEGPAEAMGLDPHLGVLHQLRSGRSSLALDLAEPFRGPLVDRFVTRLLNLRMLTAEHFTGDAENGVHLQREALPVFLRQWETELTTPVARPGGARTWRQLLRDELEGFSRWLRDGIAYTPFDYGA